MRSATSSGSPFWLMIKFARLPVAKSLLNRRAIPPRGVLLCTPGTMGPGGDRGDIFSKVAQSRSGPFSIPELLTRPKRLRLLEAVVTKGNLFMVAQALLLVSPPAKADALEMLPGRETPCPFPFPGCGVCPLITLFSCKRIEKLSGYYFPVK